LIRHDAVTPLIAPPCVIDASALMATLSFAAAIFTLLPVAYYADAIAIYH